jgi:excisionase family DNA binding protein
MVENAMPTVVDPLEPDGALVYNVRGTARALDVSESTVRRLIDRGDLRARRVGAQLRITRAELERYLATD